MDALKLELSCTGLLRLVAIDAKVALDGISGKPILAEHCTSTCTLPVLAARSLSSGAEGDLEFSIGTY